MTQIEFLSFLQDAAEWCERTLGKERFFGRRLIQVDDDDFPVDTELEGEDLADDYLMSVLALSGLERLAIVAEVETSEGALAGLGAPMLAHWRSESNDEQPSPFAMSIAVPERDLQDPVVLVARLARGVARHWVYANEPARFNNVPALIDVATIFLGFAGPLLEARVKSRSQLTSIQTQLGVLSDSELLQCLSLFAKVRGLCINDVASFVPASLQKRFLAVDAVTDANIASGEFSIEA